MGNHQSLTKESTHQSKEIFVELLTNESANKIADVIIVFIDTCWNHDDEILEVVGRLGGNKFSSEWNKLKHQKANNCQVGDVFLVDSGSLPCRHVLLAVWREGNAKETTHVELNFVVNNMLERAKGLDEDIYNIALPLGCGMDLQTHVQIMNNVFLWLMALGPNTFTHIHFLASNHVVKNTLEQTLPEFKAFTQQSIANVTSAEFNEKGHKLNEISDEDILEDAPQSTYKEKQQIAKFPKDQISTHNMEDLKENYSPQRVDDDTLNTLMDISRRSSESGDDNILCKKLIDRFPEKESIWKYYTGERGVFESIQVKKRPRFVQIDEEATEYDFYTGRPVRRTLSQSSMEDVHLDHPNFEPKRKVRRKKNKTNRQQRPESIRQTSDVFFCSICQSKRQESSKRVLQKCGHEFCSDCINNYFKEVKPKCPNCNEFYGKPLGNQPYGVMSFRIVNNYLAGFPGTDTIIIEYDIPDGIQTEKHPHPGVKFKGTQRTVYLPDNDQGRLVHKLLQKAFNQQLIFTIGRSVTTGKDNVVTWNDIHHKTRPDGGPERYGYPDPEYLDRVLEQLKKAGITDDDHE